MAKLKIDELKAHLKTDVGFTDEQLAGLTAPQLEALAGDVMRQQDYDRLMNEAKSEIEKTRSDLAAANERLNAEMAEWAQLQRSGQEQTAQQRRDYEAAQASVARLTARVTQLATDAGLDPAKALEGLEAPVPPKDAPPPAPDLSGYLKADDAHRQFGSIAEMVLEYTPTLMTLATEHQTLFGQPLDAKGLVKELRTRLTDKRNQKSTDLHDIWAELHKVPEVRETKAKEKYDADIAAAEARGREAALSEQTIPGQVIAPGRAAPIFGETPRKSAIERPQPQQTVQRAAAAFRTGKYRSQSGGQPPAA